MKSRIKCPIEVAMIHSFLDITWWRIPGPDGNEILIFHRKLYPDHFAEGESAENAEKRYWPWKVSFWRQGRYANIYCRTRKDVVATIVAWKLEHGL